MNLLSQLNSLMSPSVTSIATIVGNKGGDVWVGQTLSGGTVLLFDTDSRATGTKVYYDALTGRITGNAPNVDFQQFGV